MTSFFFSYLKSKKKSIAAFLIFAAVFVISFMLYRLPVAAVLYPLAVSAVFGTVFLLHGYFRAKHEHETLTGIKSISEIVTRDLPESDELPASDYVSAFEKLKEELLALKNAENEKYAGMIEYYTVWVHQIKTPIASMKLALSQEDSAVSRKLSAELARIEQYVEMVLCFLRLGSDSTDYVFREYDLDTVVRGAVRKFASEFVGKKVELKYEPLSFRTVTDEKWLSFVIEQVISNALKYTGEGGSISIYMKEKGILCIEDTGIGISPEDLPRVFENGYTGYNGRTDKSATGIGLYLCKRVLDGLGHGIYAESEAGRGTKMYIDLTKM